jgi:large subunit ribosomal protein L35
MPKMRTHKSAAKRFRVTASGKIIGRHTHRSHLLTRKSAARKRRLGRPLEFVGGDARRIERMLPYHAK